MAATYGDLTGFLPPGFSPIPPEILERLKGDDVEIHTVAVTPAHLLSGGGTLDRTLAALTPEHLTRLEPWLAQGRLPGPGAAELLMTRGDARALGLGIGGEVRVVTGDATRPTNRKLSMALVGLLDVPETVDVGVVATVWTEASQAIGPAMVSLAAFEKGEHGIVPARARLESAVDSSWSTAAEMQAPLLDMTAGLAGLCAQRPSSLSTARPWVEPVLPCAALSRWDEDTALQRSVMGDAIATHHEFQASERWPTTSAEGAVVPIATYQTVAILEDRFFFMETTGLPGRALRRLEPVLVEGSLEGVSAKDGIVLSRPIVDSLGLKLGDPLRIGLSSGTRLPHSYEVVSLRLAAIVEFPGRLASRLGRTSWIHRDLVRDGVGPAGRANALLVTGDPPSSVTTEPFQLVDAESVPEQDIRLRSTLHQLCNE